MMDPISRIIGIQTLQSLDYLRPKICVLDIDS